MKSKSCIRSLITDRNIFILSSKSLLESKSLEDKWMLSVDATYKLNVEGKTNDNVWQPNLSILHQIILINLVRN